MPSGSFVALTPEELAETLGGTPTAPVTAAPKATAATPRGRGSSYVELTPDELAEALSTPAPARPTAERDAPQTDGGRHPWKAGIEAAKTGLGTGLPYALEKKAADLGVGDLTPEEDANYRAQLQASQAKQEALLPGGPMSNADLAKNRLFFSSKIAI